MKKFFFLALFLLPVFVARSANKNVIPLSTAAQMQGGNSLATPVPAGVDGYAVEALWTGATLAGNIKLQASLDNSNWFDVTSSSQAVSGTGSFLWNVGNVGYPYLQVNYTPTSTNKWTVTAVTDPGAAQIQRFDTVTETCVTQVATIQTVTDVSASLNNKYFTLSGYNTGTGVSVDYYVWLSIASGGTDPAVSGKTAIPVTALANVTPNALATSIATAIALKSGFASATASGATVTVTANNCGAIPAPADGPTVLNQNTGFTFGTTTAGVDSSVNNKYFTISSINSSTKAEKDFYVWYNVNSKGTDPVPAGKTAVPVTLTKGSSSTTVASSTATALALLTNDFSAATSSANRVTVTNAKVGAVPTAANSASASPGFTSYTVNTAGVNSLNNSYFTFYSATNATCYYLWINVDSLGTDPAVATCTAAPITASHGASATTLGSSMATEIASLNSTNDFSTSASSGITTVSNKAAGPSNFPTDFGTGFTFTGSTGSGTLTSYISY